MPPLSHFAWPFFTESHRQFGSALTDWADKEAGQYIDHSDVDKSCRALVRALGKAGWLQAPLCRRPTAVCRKSSMCARSAPRAKFSPGTTASPILLSPCRAWALARYRFSATMRSKAKYLPPVRDGLHIAAFALSEPEAGSDVSALATTATKDGPAHVRIDGIKTWISNGGIADHYVVFARTGEAPGAKGLSSFHRRC